MKRLRFYNLASNTLLGLFYYYILKKKKHGQLKPKLEEEIKIIESVAKKRGLSLPQLKQIGSKNSPGPGAGS